MNFKLKSDTICIIRYSLEELYYLKKPQTTGELISRPTLFVLTKKFTNKQLALYKELPINDKKCHKISLEVHEAVFLKNILLTIIQKIDNVYSAVLMNKLIDEIEF